LLPRGRRPPRDPGLGQPGGPGAGVRGAMRALRPLVGRLVRVVGARGHDDRGQLSILTLGLTVIAMTLIIGGLAVTSAQISRMRMLDAADSAALEATDEGTERIYEEGLGETLPVSDEVVRR